MIVFLYGPDSYHRQQKTKEIIAEYQKRHSGLTLDKFYLAEEGVWSRLQNFIETPSLFDSFKLAVIYDFLAAVEGEAIILFLKQQQLNKQNCLLITAEGLLRAAKKFDFLLRQPTLVQEFKLLTGRAWTAFLLRECQKRGLRLKTSLMRLLEEVYQGDCVGVCNELDKLALAGDNNFLAQKRFLPDFFPALQKLARKEKTAGPLLERLLSQEDAGKIFNLLACLVAKEERQMMADYDVAVKMGKLDYPEVLLDFLLR